MIEKQGLLSMGWSGGNIWSKDLNKEKEWAIVGRSESRSISKYKGPGTDWSLVCLAEAREEPEWLEKSEWGGVVGKEVWTMRRNWTVCDPIGYGKESSLCSNCYLLEEFWAGRASGLVYIFKVHSIWNVGNRIWG